MRKMLLKAFLIALLFMPVMAQAQEDTGVKRASSPPFAVASEEKSWQNMLSRIARVNPEISLEQIPSLFFTPSEQSLVAEARLGLTTRAPTDTELRQAEKGDVPMGARELSLGGIVYASAGEWTIWLNGQKVTPERLPPEILDIKVRRSDIKLKWFDAYTNQIFPIKLRAHQRFNIDTRIFLPGEAPREVVSEY